ncbi:hypothetical protein H9W95_06220 [Flavobacterium lindanitolerans]|nr:hypothetical protein [Flavobacterium lindanitolerans]
MRVYECGHGCSLMWILAYIKKPNDEFAYIPVDYNRLNLFNLGKIDDKFLKPLRKLVKIARNS